MVGAGRQNCSTYGGGRMSSNIDVGWFIDLPFARSVFLDPMPLNDFVRRDPKVSRKSPDFCPALQAMSLGMYVVPVPFDLTLRCRNEGSSFDIVLDIKRSTLGRDMATKLISVTAMEDWRARSRPILQFKFPYTFVTDADVQLELFPPMLSYQNPPWPGVQFSGSFPIRNWPRQLSWAFEWHDFERPLVLRRGRPWCLVRLRGAHGEIVGLRRIQETSEIAEYRKQLLGVASVVHRTFDLMGTAAERRPEKLLPEELKKPLTEEGQNNE